MSGDFLLEDLEDMFDEDELADRGYLSDGRSFPLHFLESYQAGELLGIEIENAEPWALCKTSDLKDSAQGLLLTIGTAPADGTAQDDRDGEFVSDNDSAFDESGQKQYRVINVKRDPVFAGPGTTLLILSKD